MARGGHVNMDDEEGNQQKSSYGVDESQGLQSHGDYHPHLIVKDHHQARSSHHRKDEHQESQVSDALQGIQLNVLAAFVGMRLPLEHARGVVANLLAYLLPRRFVLLPLASGEKPEHREQEQNHQGKAQQAMNHVRLFEGIDPIGAVDAKTGKAQSNDEDGLAPVPKPLESGVEMNFFLGHHGLQLVRLLFVGKDAQNRMDDDAQQGQARQQPSQRIYPGETILTRHVNARHLGQTASWGMAFVTMH